MSDYNINPLQLREIILNARKPIVFKSFPINWSCFQGGLEAWCTTFDGSNFSPANFERIAKTDCYEPQWERKRKLVQMSLMQFLEEHSKDCDYWSGLNYKRRDELPPECTDGIDFSKFGFSQVADDAAIWLCSSNANTPCHYDSYGCNIVVQVFGNKSWHLFPQNAPLTTTRIPYEESSIYCKENFYSPSEDMMKHIESYKDLVYHVKLEPSDVLIVPKHWWHYVEAIDVSLSVNAWIPLKNDLEQQIEECIVKYLIENFVKDSPLSTKTYVVNPNQLTSFTANDELLKILKYLLDKSLMDDSKAKSKQFVYDYHYLSVTDTEVLLNDSKSFKLVSTMTSNALRDFLKSRHAKDVKNSTDEGALDLLQEVLINSICSPSVIKSIKTEFIKRYKDKY